MLLLPVYFKISARARIYSGVEMCIRDSGRTVGRGKTKELFQNPGTRAAARLTGLKNFSEVEKINDHKVYALSLIHI